jgi:hypothetical protein
MKAHVHGYVGLIASFDVLLLILLHRGPGGVLVVGELVEVDQFMDSGGEGVELIRYGHFPAADTDVESLTRYLNESKMADTFHRIAWGEGFYVIPR